MEERAPIRVKQNTVGLERILHVHPWLAVFLLVCDRLLEEREAHQCWLAALPGKSNLRDMLSLDVLASKFLERGIAHTEGRAWIELFFLQVEAVLAIEIANRAARCYQHMKSAWRRWPTLVCR